MTKAEIQDKSDATRLRNLLARKAERKTLTERDEAVLTRLSAKLGKPKGGVLVISPVQESGI